MNGFIFLTGPNVPNLDPKRIAPVADGKGYDLKCFGSGDYLLTWGNNCGDVCFAEQTGRAVLILSGYITDIESGFEFKSQEEAAHYLLSEFMRATSEKVLEQLLNRTNGSFGIVFRDYDRAITICVTDRISSRPLWRYREGTCVFLSTHVSAIALSMKNPRMDPVALCTFMLYGGPVNPSRSLFQGVEGIPSGSINTMGSEGRSDIYKWYHFRHQEDAALSIDEWVELLAERLVKAATRISRQCRKPVVFFSGGIDSRLVASAMKSAGSAPLLVTLADSVNLEVLVAKLAAKALGLNHRVIMRDPHWYLRRLPGAVYETGGIYVWTHGHFSAAAEMIRNEHDADVFILGDFCEAFSKLLCSPEPSRIELWTPQEFRKVFDSIHLPLYRPYNRKVTLSLFNQNIRKEIEECIGSDVEQRFSEVRSLASDPLIVGDLCFRWETVTSTPTFFMFLDLRKMVSERNLMFDRDVHQLLEKLPAKMRNNKNLGARVIKQLQPKAAWVMNSNSLMPMFWPPAVHQASKRIKPVLGKVRRFIFGKTHRTTGSWPEHSALYTSDPQWRRYFESILENEDLFDEELFDMKAIRQCWEELSSGHADRSADAEKLIQIGLLSKMLEKGATNFVQENSSMN